MRALLVPVGRDAYAIRLDEVREVLQPPVITAVPTAPDALIGVFNLRGEVVALLDAARLLDIEDATDVVAVVVVDTPAGIAALSATGRTSSIELGEPIADSRGPGTCGRFEVDGGVVTLLDLPVVLQAVGRTP